MIRHKRIAGFPARVGNRPTFPFCPCSVHSIGSLDIAQRNDQIDIRRDSRPDLCCLECGVLCPRSTNASRVLVSGSRGCTPALTISASKPYGDRFRNRTQTSVILAEKCYPSISDVCPYHKLKSLTPTYMECCAMLSNRSHANVNSSQRITRRVN